MAPTRADDVIWNRHFKELEDYKRSHGCFPPRQDQLGVWINKQRAAYKAGTLSDARQRRLNSFVDFVWEPTHAAWERRFRELVAFKNAHGHWKPPKAQHRQLVIWVKEQRRRKLNDILLTERLERLNEIGFEWQPGRGQSFAEISAKSQEQEQEEEQTEEQEEKAGGHMMNHSKSLPLVTHEARGNNLKGPIKLLTERDVAWERRFQELVAFKSSYGHCKIPKSQHRQLVIWAKEQRRRKLNGILLKERLERLNGIGFDWQPGRRQSFPEISAESQEEEQKKEQKEEQEEKAGGRKINHSKSPPLATHEASGNDLEELRKLLTETRKELSETKQEMAALKSANAATNRQLEDTQTSLEVLSSAMKQMQEQFSRGQWE